MTPPVRRLKKRRMSGDITDSIPAAYPATAEAREALRRTSKRLSDTQQMRYPAQGDAMAALPTDERCTASTDTINDFAVGTTRRLQNPKMLPALWLVIARQHPDALAKALRDVRIEKLIGSDPLTNALHDFWLPGRALNHDRLTAVGGFYAAYIPFFYDTTQIMIVAVDCGLGGDDPGRFRLDMAYRDDAGKLCADRVEGAIIPYEENIMFVGGIAGKVAPYMFALTNFPITDNRIERGEGALLAAARATLPTASPILIQRQERLPEPRVIDREEASALPEGRLICRVMARGNVRWQ